MTRQWLSSILLVLIICEGLIAAGTLDVACHEMMQEAAASHDWLPMQVLLPKGVLSYLRRTSPAASNVTLPVVLQLQIAPSAHINTTQGHPASLPISSSQWPTYGSGDADVLVAEKRQRLPHHDPPLPVILEESALRSSAPLSSLEELYPLAKNPWRWSASPPLAIHIRDKDLYGGDLLRDNQEDILDGNEDNDEQDGINLMDSDLRDAAAAFHAAYDRPAAGIEPVPLQDSTQDHVQSDEQTAKRSVAIPEVLLLDICDY
jgi:hypothetical protein